MIDIKNEPELRHAFAHISYAIRALADGCPRVAQMELDSIEELIFWADDSNEALELDLAAREKVFEEEILQSYCRLRISFP